MFTSITTSARSLSMLRRSSPMSRTFSGVSRTVMELVDLLAVITGWRPACGGIEGGVRWRASFGATLEREKGRRAGCWGCGGLVCSATGMGWVESVWEKKAFVGEIESG